MRGSSFLFFFIIFFTSHPSLLSPPLMKFLIPLSVLASALQLTSAAPAAGVKALNVRDPLEGQARAASKCSNSQFLNPKTNKCQDCSKTFPHASACNKDGPLRCKLGNLEGCKCELAKCKIESATYLSDDGRRCLRCKDKGASECTATKSLECKKGYLLSDKRVCVKVTCTPPKVLSQDQNGCCLDPNASACSDTQASTACKSGYQLKNNSCKLIVCKAPLAVVSDDSNGCCFDPHATKCSDRITSTSCAVGYKLDRNECKIDESRTCKPPLAVYSDDNNGCCFDPHATKCSDRITSTACAAGYKLDVNECKAIVCTSPQSVVSDDNTGCCFDPQATKCSTPSVATACTDLFDVDGNVCTKNAVCPVPTYKPKHDTGPNCCMDPYATSCFNDFKSTACVEGRRLGKGACVPPKCEAPYVQSQDDSGCCTDPYATACSSASVSTKCKRGYRTLGTKCVKS
ncbi:hypothetical protein MVLG_04379 [Microbotryum lychnidis-dioicae p1A1 Lamole]|uniref:TNFR-Cys domain-containing protein n=1 Tax=Microbotryum lychnidis-dioicae (strain p1A1 Lamole / MvSl-1064) TaxID=683840 RepID=U5HB17_USTV1|nr:hypothetical protein MVLG_04379 [Microbotryum lychnidis-dioicae p1A1 Lamole]|eukprot:KDE05244.1 hypothetical protein MVLG_04379 [Microbotryum lychnidis-dioicae p1A1 Lamole]